MGFGILTALHNYVPFLMYCGVIIVSVLSCLGYARFGLYFLVCLIPFTYSLIKAQQYPLGSQIMDILFLSIIIGSFTQSGGINKPKSAYPVVLLMMIYFIALLNGYFWEDINTYVDHTARMQQWKNFIIMPILYFLAYENVRGVKQTKILIYLIVIVLFIVEWKFYTSYSWLMGREHFSYEVRGGQFGYLGANEFASFLLNYTALCIGLFLFSLRGWLRLLMLMPIFFGIFDILYSFSRGAYLGLSLVLIFFSLFKKKLMFGFILFVLCFSVIGLQVLPQSVLERIQMTKTDDGEIESSAGGRIMLWNHVLQNIFPENPIIGAGYGIFKYIPDKSGQCYGDPHSNYMETLAEQGIIGLGILIFIYYSSFRSGWHLFKGSENIWVRGLGIGFCGCVLGSLVANLFGDRWTHYQVMSFFWIIWGVVDRCNSEIPDMNSSRLENGTGHVK